MNNVTMKINAAGLAQAIDKAPALLHKNMRSALRSVLARIARTAKRYAPKAFSNLVNSIDTRLISDFEGAVYAGKNYALAVEQGTGAQGPRGIPSAKMPPVSSIEDWVKVRGLTPKKPGDTTRDIAYAIARSIALKGTPAQPFMGRSLEHNAEDATRRINDAIGATLAEL